MSINSETSRYQYACDHSQTAFPFNALFFRNEDIKVVLTEAAGNDTLLTLGTHYSVTGANDPDGGTVTTMGPDSPYPSGKLITIYRDVPSTQTTVYAEGADFPAASHERALDRLTMICQQLKRIAGNAIALSASSDAPSPVTAEPDAIFTLDSGKHLLLRTRDEFVDWLSLGAHSITDKEIKIFSIAADRTGGKADYLGQIGVQLDTGQLYLSTAINVAGAWAHTVPGVNSVTDAMLVTALDLSGKTITFPAGLISGQTAAASAAGTDTLLLYDGSALKKISRDVLLTSMESVSGFANLNVVYHDTGFATVTADSIVLEDSNGRRVRRNSITTDCLIYASGSANRLDTGTPASNTWYCLWAIHNSTSNGTGCDMLFSLSGTSPTLPTGYTFKKKLGWARVLDATTGGAGSAHVGYFLKGIQYGKSVDCEPKSPFTGIAGNITGQNQTLTGFVPPDAPWVRGVLGRDTVGTGTFILSADLNFYNGYTHVNICNNGNVMDSMADGVPFRSVISTSPSSRSISFRTDSTDTAYSMKITGWDYNL